MSEPYKRYLVFECVTYYPSGGLNDVKKDFDDLQEAIVYCRDLWACEVVQLFDRVEGVTVEWKESTQ